MKPSLSVAIVLFVTIVMSVMLFVAFRQPTQATHLWGNYHWARTSNPFTLKLGDNVSEKWDSYLVTSSIDWSVSIVLDTIIVPGKTSARTCKPTLGQAEICNYRYGKNGWLGIAQIWISGDHITKGVVKMNDTYFDTATYNTTAWKNLVMCQEIGHIFGLGHQDEIHGNANLDTCMDYTSNPETNQHPNLHDYEQLELMYEHLDNINTIAFSPNALNSGFDRADIDLNNPKEWGKAVKKDAKGNPSLYVRNYPGNKKLITHVFWVEDYNHKD